MHGENTLRKKQLCKILQMHSDLHYISEYDKCWLFNSQYVTDYSKFTSKVLKWSVKCCATIYCYSIPNVKSLLLLVKQNIGVCSCNIYKCIALGLAFK